MLKKNRIGNSFTTFVEHNDHRKWEEYPDRRIVARLKRHIEAFEAEFKN